MTELKHCLLEKSKHRLIVSCVSAAENQLVLTTSELARRLREAMDGHRPRIKAVDLAVACDVTPQAVNGWRKSGRIHKRHLEKISTVTGKPLTYFLHVTPLAAQPLAAYLTDDEQRMLQAYRESTPSWRLTLRRLASIPDDLKDPISDELNRTLARLGR